MLYKTGLLTAATLLTLIPLLTYAKSDDPAERIGVGVISALLLVGFFAVVNWVKSKNNKEDNNKPL